MQQFQESRRWPRVLLPGAALTGFIVSAVYVDVTTVAGFTTSLVAASAVVAAFVGFWGFLRWHTRRPALKPACIVRLDGRLDSRVAKAHRAVLNEIVLRGHVNLLFDCRRVTFIDSTGLSVLIATQKAIDPMHGAIALSHLEEHLRELFEVTGLDSRFSIHDDLATALEKLGWTAAGDVSPSLLDATNPCKPTRLT